MLKSASPHESTNWRNIPGWVKLHYVSPLRINRELMLASGLPQIASGTSQTAPGLQNCIRSQITYYHRRIHWIRYKKVKINLKSQTQFYVIQFISLFQNYPSSFHFFIIVYKIVQKNFCSIFSKSEVVFCKMFLI